MSPNCTKRLESEVKELRSTVKSQSKVLAKLVRQLKDGCKKDEEPPKSTLCGLNPCMVCLKPDILYHLGLDTCCTDFPKVFGDVKFVCMGGTVERMENFSYYIMKEIGLQLNAATQLRDMAAKGKRFGMFKAGPVLCVSHGMGCPSISIVLHELIKMMAHANCIDPIFIRMGTSGGIGVEPGTVIISSEAVNANLEASYEMVVQGNPVSYPTDLNEDVAEQIRKCHDPCNDPFECIVGRTMCTHDFYEGQSRCDGAFCDYTPETKREYLESLEAQEVKNIEMESLAFAALTKRACIRSAVVCVTILNRLNGDQIKVDPVTLREFDMRPAKLVSSFIRSVLYPQPEDSDDEASEMESGAGDSSGGTAPTATTDVVQVVEVVEE